MNNNKQVEEFIRKIGSEEYQKAAIAKCSDTEAYIHNGHNPIYCMDTATAIMDTVATVVTDVVLNSIGTHVAYAASAALTHFNTEEEFEAFCTSQWSRDTAMRIHSCLQYFIGGIVCGVTRDILSEEGLMVWADLMITLDIYVRGFSRLLAHRVLHAFCEHYDMTYPLDDILAHIENANSAPESDLPTVNYFGSSPVQ